MEPPDTFPFPFTPYRIQKEFMTSLYAAMENGKLGIFESPTGTGKSLSLICGALTWLCDHEKYEEEKLKSALETLNEISSEHSNSNHDPFDWINQQAVEVKERQEKAETKLKLDMLQKYNSKIAKLRQASKQRKLKPHQEELMGAGRRSDHSKLLKKETVKENEDEDEDLILEEWSDISIAGDASDEEEVENEGPHRTKLAQFIGEIQRSSFCENIRVVPLASRQNSCINESVNKLKSLSLINEKQVLVVYAYLWIFKLMCLDLQKRTHKVTATSSDGQVSKKARNSGNTSGCPAMNRFNIQLLSEDVLTEVQDIEQIVKAGKKARACPYYATRASVPDAQVVVVPYNTILHKSTREACGIQLKNNIVIIDEAHNLLEAIGNIHSAQVSGYQLSHAHSQLLQYRDRYQKRFNPKTLLLLGQLIFVLGKLTKILGGKVGGNPDDTKSTVLENKIFTLPEFVLAAEVDNLNLYRLLEFCKTSKISHKLHGFSARYQTTVNISKSVVKNQGMRAFLKEMETRNSKSPDLKPADLVRAFPGSDDENKSNMAPVVNLEGGNNPFLPVMAFLETLTNHCDDGRILLKRGQTVGKGVLKFLLLNPAAHFQDIVLQARSVIVAGGTMQPISEFQDQLFLSAGGSLERISTFSCGHIIPPENILPIALGSGPSGKHFDFSYAQRDSPDMINEMGRLLTNICNFVPAGIVCFFPSYDYEKYVIDHFVKTGVLNQIESKKKIFREPKQSSEVDVVLTSYATCIRRSKTSDTKLTGAILFSVIGGKLSEGLNFSDDLGRCVVVVGLPYPNIKSVELQEQMKFLDSSVGRGAGQRHYENLCMKAVNQSIGRAVRHKDDYAAVLLLDQRYLQKSRQSALPSWIQRSLESHDRFGSAFASLRK
ncbi:ATP-dependent DNA helicase DDX11, partial [Frankliniella fusca]